MGKGRNNQKEQVWIKQQLAECGGYSQEAFERRLTKSSIERLRQVTSMLDCVKITNNDYERCISKTGKSVFIFLDPPYRNSKKSRLYGENGRTHKSFDHERLADAVRKSKHKIMLTYDDSEEIRKLYRFAKI